MRPGQTHDEGLPPLSPHLEAAVARERSETLPNAEQQWSKLVDQLHRERGLRAHFREQSTNVRNAWLLLLSVLILAVNLFAMPRPDLSVIPLVRLGLDLAIYGVPLIGLWLLVLRPVHRPRLARAAWLIGVLGVAALMLVASLPAAHADHPASLAGTGDDLVARARGCFLFGTAMALPVLLFARVLMRDDASLWSVGGLLAVFAAVVGNVSLYFHCPIVAPVHLWAGHVAVLVPFAALAIWSRRRI
jgi:hypothetical protein